MPVSVAIGSPGRALGFFPSFLPASFCPTQRRPYPRKQISPSLTSLPTHQGNCKVEMKTSWWSLCLRSRRRSCLGTLFQEANFSRPQHPGALTPYLHNVATLKILAPRNLAWSKGTSRPGGAIPRLSFPSVCLFCLEFAYLRLRYGVLLVQVHQPSRPSLWFKIPRAGKTS